MVLLHQLYIVRDLDGVRLFSPSESLVVRFPPRDDRQAQLILEAPGASANPFSQNWLTLCYCASVSSKRSCASCR